MTIKQLHEITAQLIAKGKGATDVSVDTRTCNDNSDAPIELILGARIRRVRGVDDSGLTTGPKFSFLVLNGGFEN